MENSRLSEIYDFRYGTGNNNPDNGGIYPIYGSNGIIGGYSKYNSEDSPVIGHIGANCGAVVFGKGKHFVTYNGVICKIKKGVDSKFGYYVLLASNLKRLGFGSAQPFISYGTLKRVAIYKPNYDIQVKLGRILSNYDQLIENNNKRIKLLEQMAEGLYKEWFVRFRFPGYEKTCFVNGIPEGWKYKKFSKCFNTSRGISYSSEEIECEDGMNLINLKNIQSYGGFRRDGTKKYSGKYKKDQTVKYKDLIMGVTDMTQDRRTVGHVALVPNIEGVISADLIKLDSDINNLFWYCLFRYGFYSKMFSQFGNGSNVIHLKPQSIKNQKILVPILELIEKFVKKVELIIDEIEILNAKNELLAEQRDLLLPRLMSGKIDLEDKEVI